MENRKSPPGSAGFRCFGIEHHCSSQVLIPLRLERRAWALAGRLPWLAFFSLRWVLAIIFSSGDVWSNGLSCGRPVCDSSSGLVAIVEKMAEATLSNQII